MNPLYHNFIGIDIGKETFYTNVHGRALCPTFLNTPAGWQAFVEKHQAMLEQAFLVLETTGGYETGLLLFLRMQGIAVHRADTRKVKRFIQSWGKNGKSDSIDAKALALYGQERHRSLALYEAADKVHQELFELTQRRIVLMRMVAQEKTRLQGPRVAMVAESHRALIAVLMQEVRAINAKIQERFDAHPALKAERSVLMTVPGIGIITAQALLSLLPEIGRLNRRKIASLAGLAPHPNESGKTIGYRRTKGGRSEVRSALFMAGMAAMSSKSPLGSFYASLIGRGKRKMVALTALMRKILVIANARLRDHLREVAAKETAISA